MHLQELAFFDLLDHFDLFFFFLFPFSFFPSPFPFLIPPFSSSFFPPLSTRLTYVQ